METFYFIFRVTKTEKTLFSGQPLVDSLLWADYILDECFSNLFLFYLYTRLGNSKKVIFRNPSFVAEKK